ncbi:Cyanovirin-N [Mycena rebaudengoi]|nr:Cyanovirin-N [Mycena rebaudengoi]
MSFSDSSQNFRLVGTTLHAQCHDKHGHLHNSTLDLNDILGNNDGNFDTRGSHFHESSGICGLNHTTLVATLRRSDGTYHGTTFDLNSFVRNDDGKLKRVKA